MTTSTRQRNSCPQPRNMLLHKAVLVKYLRPMHIPDWKAAIS
jgi:hypothetical protein